MSTHTLTLNSQTKSLKSQSSLSRRDCWKRNYNLIKHNLRLYNLRHRDVRPYDSLLEAGLYKFIQKDDDKISRLKKKLNKILNGDIIDIGSFDDYSKIYGEIKDNEKKIFIKLKQCKKAKKNYIKFHENNVNIDLSKITFNDISNSSAGIEGWANANFDL